MNTTYFFFFIKLKENKCALKTYLNTIIPKRLEITGFEPVTLRLQNVHSAN